MGAAKKLIDKKALRNLVPLNALSPMHVDEVAAKAVIEEIRSGRFIFRQGDRDNQSIYVLDGEVSIIGDDNEVLGSVLGGADNARHPIGHQQPRQVSARAKSNVIVARIDSSLLDVLLTWDESSGYEVSEIESDEEDDWMTRMLQSPAFMQLPPANIQQLLMKMESLTAKAGDVIVRQGDEGDYFYVITTGRCVVTRKATAQGKEVKLAELGGGASFGEDSLVSNNKRNATITMLTDGTLMRLAKQDFQELLQAPLVHQVSYEQAARLAEDGAIWLDVRLPGEFENGAIPGARNIPLSGLRDPSTRLEEEGRFILCCDTGRRSASGAFVLSQRGLDVYVLEGGLHAVPAAVLVRADGTPAHAAPAVASADVIPLESPAESESAEDGDARLSELKARYDREVERIKEFQETARQTIQSAQQARKAAEEQVGSLQAQLEEAQAALARAEAGDGGADGRVQALEQQLEKAALAQEQLRGELRDAQETQGEAEARLKQVEQQLCEARELARRELAEARTELDASRQQIAELEQEQEQHEARLQQQRETLESGQGESAQRLEQLSGELETTRAELGQAQTALQAAEQARAELEAQQQAVQHERDALQARLESAGAEAQNELGESRQRIEQLEAELATLRQGHEELGSRASQLASERDDAQQQLALLQQEQAGLQERIEALSASTGEAQQALCEERDAARVEVEQARSRVAELEQSLQARGQDLESLQALVARHEEQLREQQAATASAAEQAAAREAEAQTALQDARDQLSALQQELEQRDQRLQEIEATLQESGVLHQDQQQQLEGLQAQLAERDSALQHLQQEMEAAGGRESGLQAELDALRREGEAALAEARTQVESARQALGEEKETLQQELERLRAELAENARTLELRQSEQAALEQARHEAEQALAERAGQEAALREQLASLEQALEEARQSAAASAEAQAGQFAEREQGLAQQVEELRAELARHSAGAAELESGQQQLRAELDAALEARQLLEQELTALREQDAARQAEQEAELQARQQEISRLEGELAALKGGEAELDAERQRLQQERDAAQAELAAAQEQDRAAGAEQEQLRQQLAEQEALLASIRAELAGATENREQEQARVQGEMDELRHSLESAQAELTRLRAEQASAATESLPSPGLESRIATLEEQLEQAQSEAQELRTREQVMREEVDKLRAETEVAQGLAELQGAAGTRNKGALEQELAQARQNVEVAVRLRTEAEEGRHRAEMELRRLQESLAARDAEAPLRAPVVEVPSLDEEDESLPHAVAAAPTAAPPAPEPRAAVSEPSRPRGAWLGVLLGVVLGGAGAAGGFFLLQSGADPEPAGVAVATEEAPAVAPATSGAAEPPAQVTAAPAAPPAAPTAPAPEPAWEPVGRSFSDPLSAGGRGPRMVELRATEYQMGSAAGLPHFDERPRHAVRLEAFAIASREVSFAEYDQFARASGRRLPDDMGWGRGSQPVINVSWEDALAYADWLSAQTGRRYRLPTEAEWEYAARAGQETRYWWGNDLGAGRANCHGCGSRWDGLQPAPVGSFAASPFGLHDMNGNVQEWVQDCYRDSYRDAPADGGAVEAASCGQRVVRGGGYASAPDSLRSAARNKLAPDSRLDHVGFRVVRGR